MCCGISTREMTVKHEININFCLNCIFYLHIILFYKLFAMGAS